MDDAVTAALPPYRPRAAVRALARRDGRMADLLAAIGPVEIPQKPSSFASIARAIVYQQLSGRAAAAIWSRLVAACGGGELEPRDVLRRRPSTLRRAGLSAAKTASVRDLARHVRDGRVDPQGLGDMEDDAVVRTLTQVHGIGPWSAHMHLIFALARPDVWPTADLGVRKGLQRFLALDRVPTIREAEPLGEPYRPWRTVLAWSMWRIHDVEAWV